MKALDQIRAEALCEGNTVKLYHAIDRLIRALEKAVEQRDGYRDNYWAICGIVPLQSDRKEIMEENNAEIEAILEGERE